MRNAEAYLKKFGGEHFHIESAGLEPAEGVNPLVIDIMREEDIDLATTNPKAFSNYLSRVNCTIMSLPFAPIPNHSAPFFQESPKDGTGHFQIRLPCRARMLKKSIRSARSVT